MGDLMRPLAFPTLLEWALAEHRRHGSVFGLRSEHFFRPSGRTVRDACGHPLATPVGPAAGPHTQLAQNIVTPGSPGPGRRAQDGAGASTGTPCGRPCRSRASTPRTRASTASGPPSSPWPQAFAEYVHAHLAIAVLAAELDLDHDVAFNASVGYDLAGTAPAGHGRLHRGTARRLGDAGVPRGDGVARGPPRALHPLRPRAPGAHLPAGLRLVHHLDDARLPGGRDRADGGPPARQGPAHPGQVQPDHARVPRRARPARRPRLRAPRLRRPPLRRRPPATRMPCRCSPGSASGRTRPASCSASS